MRISPRLSIEPHEQQTTRATSGIERQCNGSVKFISLSSYMKIGALQMRNDYYSKTNFNLINCKQELPIYR